MHGMDALEKENEKLMKVLRIRIRKLNQYLRVIRPVDFRKVDRDVDTILGQIDELQQGNVEKRVAIEKLEKEIKNLKAENLKKKATETPKSLLLLNQNHKLA